MNFLAHLYLAQNADGKIGNFIADAVKGNAYKRFPSSIQAGILHHRAIDSFTDSHPVVKKSKRRLNSQYGHYKAVIIDIVYDHFLAKNWTAYSKTTLNTFCQESYELLNGQFARLPEKTKYLLPFMTEQNWLYNYRTVKGISHILEGMNQRTKGKSKMDLAKFDLIEKYAEFETDFTVFFKDLQAFSTAYLKERENEGSSAKAPKKNLEKS